MIIGRLRIKVYRAIIIVTRIIYILCKSFSCFALYKYYGYMIIVYCYTFAMTLLKCIKSHIRQLSLNKNDHIDQLKLNLFSF